MGIVVNSYRFMSINGYDKLQLGGFHITPDTADYFVF